MLSVQHQSLNLTLHQVGYSKHNRPAEVITLCWMSGVGSVVFVMIHLRCMYHCFHSFRDAVETCSALKSADEKEQCFLNFGLDSHAVSLLLVWLRPCLRTDIQTSWLSIVVNLSFTGFSLVWPYGLPFIPRLNSIMSLSWRWKRLFKRGAMGVRDQFDPPKHIYNLYACIYSYLFPFPS
jgi:hypothetical protein